MHASIRKNRFEQFMQFLHFADNANLDVNDCCAKLRPLIRHFQVKFREHFIPEQCLSHDEALIEYFGHSFLKQHIIQKPIRFGYEVFCLNTPSGYHAAFEPYQGRKGNYDAGLAEKFGKNAATVLSNMQLLPSDKRALPYHISVDNRFTTFPQFAELSRMGYSATGTIRVNKIKKECPLANPIEMKKHGKREDISAVRGKSVEQNSEFNLVRWKDNNVVTVCSTAYGTEPVTTVERWSRAE